MPLFSQYTAFDHRIDNQIIKKEDLRFHDEGSAAEFATTQYLSDFIPRSVIVGMTGLHMVVESPHPRLEGYIPHPREVFYINSTPGEG
jgi:methyl coenzyme M reductase alpha subunit